MSPFAMYATVFAVIITGAIQTYGEDPAPPRYIESIYKTDPVVLETLDPYLRALCVDSNDHNLYHEIYQRIQTAVVAEDDVEDHLAKLPRLWIAVSEVLDSKAQIDNGGLREYFLIDQPGGQRMIESFRVLELPEFAEILQRAANIFPGDATKLSHAERIAAAERFGEDELVRFGALETEFFRACDYFADHMGKFLRDHMAEFRELPRHRDNYTEPDYRKLIQGRRPIPSRSASAQEVARWLEGIEADPEMTNGVIDFVSFDSFRNSTVAELAALSETSAVETVTSIKLVDTRISDSEVHLLRKFPKLKYVCLSGTKVTDEAVKTLIDCKALKAVDLYDSKITTKGMRELINALELESLNYSSSEIESGTESVHSQDNL